MSKPAAPDSDYETEGHLRTLNDAAEIMSDPKKLKKVHKLAGRHHKAVMDMVEPKMKKPIRSIAELKARAQEPDQDD